MKKVTPFLWFESKAEEAAKFYVSVFRNSKMLSVSRPGPPGGGAPVFSATFQIGNQEFIAFNGGPFEAFSSATSFMVECADQAEVDEYWEKLSAGGEVQQCGWLKDMFGVTWQIVPSGLEQLLYGPDAEASKRAMDAMLKMIKLDIAVIRKAYEKA
jgi:predicted 3-demethylubiquinone-9 3-methyltransferase (glyoxalase superfamily)